MRCIGIVGVGLIGGSFGLALRAAGFDGEILGVSSPPAIEAGIKRGAIDRGVLLEEAAQRADLLYLSQTVDRILESIRQLGNFSSENLLITDAGSTKGLITSTAHTFLRKGQFLGGHPMAGKEERGAAAADPNLFRGRPYVLTSTCGCAEWEPFRSWLLKIGAHIVEMDPAEHDRTVALTSHLPQLLSTALAATLARRDERYANSVFGPGLIDMTRLALSETELWSSILSTNKEALEDAVDAFLAALKDVQRSIGTSNLGERFSTARAFAAQIREVSSRGKII